MASSNFTNTTWRIFGLSALTSTAQFAFLSNWVSTLHTIAKRIPDAERLLDEVQNSHHSNSSISRDLCNVLPQNKTLVEVSNDRKLLQHKLTEEYMKSLSNGFIRNSSSTRDQSRMKSLQGKGAGAWLPTVPSSSWHALSPCGFGLASLMRLGCQMPLASGQCGCGKELDSDGYHLITCKTWGAAR